MNWVSDNNDFWDIISFSGLVDTASDGKKFHLCACDIYHMVKSFGNRFVVNISMWDGSSNVVLNASIHNDKSMGGNTWRFNSQIIKLLNLGFEIVIFAFAEQMEREAIR